MHGSYLSTNYQIPISRVDYDTQSLDRRRMNYKNYNNNINGINMSYISETDGVNFNSFAGSQGLGLFEIFCIVSIVYSIRQINFA